MAESHPESHLSHSAKARVFHSYQIPNITEITSVEEYQQVLEKIANNVKIGPFETTSGISLPCTFHALSFYS